MKYFLTIIFICVFIAPCNAFSLFGDENGIYRNDIANAERLLFGRKNSFHSQENRLGLLERELFGTVQSGSVHDRISLINRVLASREFNNKAYSSPAKINRIKRNIFASRNYNHNNYRRNVRNHGRMTSFEPPIHEPPTPNFYSSERNFHHPYRQTQRINTKIPQPYGYGNNRFSPRMRFNN